MASQGALAGILMGLAQLSQSELRLKRLCNKHGILGLDRLCLYAISEWVRDVKRHQLPSLLGGVGPMHSFIQLCKFYYPTHGLPHNKTIMTPVYF